MVSSSNLGVIYSERDEITLHYLLRSAHENPMLDLTNRLKENFVTAGGIMKIRGEYPGWIPNPDSSILKSTQTSYLELYQSNPVLKLIHAGLECGIIGTTFPGIDVISIGPTIVSPHSPNECVEIASVSRLWEFIKVLLKNIS
ncbi:MAG: aminoacyl-histidine dipeptidase [Proteobacteria bacterium]|nr:aminoacyl-histidine dipeptidase [Pseudomonadota bacterium]